MLAKKAKRRIKIKHQIRKKISGTSTIPRLAVFRSNTDIYAQVIDDTVGNTLLVASTKELGKDRKGPKVEQSKAVGLLLAKKVIAAGLKEIVFDRGGYLYHGRVKSLAEGVREGGIKF